jgi:hypothetical protein
MELEYFLLGGTYTVQNHVAERGLNVRHEAILPTSMACGPCCPKFNLIVMPMHHRLLLHDDLIIRTCTSKGILGLQIQNKCTSRSCRTKVIRTTHRIDACDHTAECNCRKPPSHTLFLCKPTLSVLLPPPPVWSTPTGPSPKWGGGR